MGGVRTPLRALMVGWLAIVWHQWISTIAFPFGGGEGHWVMMHSKPLKFTDGLFLGGLSALAGESLAAVLKAKRVWVALVVGVGVPGLVLGRTGGLDGSVSDLVSTLAGFGLPLVVVGLVTVVSRVRLGWVGIGVAAWWPGFLHLFLYQRATGLPEDFRDGVAVMWVAGGLVVGAVARGCGAVTVEHTGNDYGTGQGPLRGGPANLPVLPEEKPPVACLSGGELDRRPQRRQDRSIVGPGGVPDRIREHPEGDGGPER